MRVSHPFDDEKMFFNRTTGRYQLTEAAIVDCGISVRSRIEANPSMDATVVINAITRRVSELIYGYIHSFAVRTDKQDELIATVPSLRRIIYDALCRQLVYFLHVGDVSHSLNADERRHAIDASAKEALEEVVPELGTSILFAGGRYGLS